MRKRANGGDPKLLHNYPFSASLSSESQGEYLTSVCNSTETEFLPCLSSTVVAVVLSQGFCNPTKILPHIRKFRIPPIVAAKTCCMEPCMGSHSGAAGPRYLPDHLVPTPWWKWAVWLRPCWGSTVPSKCFSAPRPCRLLQTCLASLSEAPPGEGATPRGGTSQRGPSAALSGCPGGQIRASLKACFPFLMAVCLPPGREGCLSCQGREGRF